MSSDITLAIIFGTVLLVVAVLIPVVKALRKAPYCQGDCNQGRKQCNCR